MAADPVRLFHGSDVVVEHPDTSRNSGFSDLGTGFYLTDDRDAASRRAKGRARREGTAAGIVSVFEFGEGCLPWVEWGTEPLPVRTERLGVPYGLRFAPTGAGVAAWIDYIRACRRGDAGVPGFGSPAVVRAWIATEEVELACAGFVEAEELAGLIDITSLVVQYCFLDQEVLDRHLLFVQSFEL